MPADQSYIGLTGQPVRMRIEHGKIREFAAAVKDPDPLYRDEVYAEEIAGGVMPPVTFLASVMLWDDGTGRPNVPLDPARTLHGEQDIELLKPIHAGDVLNAVTRVSDVYTKAGKRGGGMTFVVNETEFTNAKGEAVARMRNVRIETAKAVEG